MNIRLPLRLFLTALCVCGIACQAYSATVSLTPTADAFVSSANPTNNYGGAGSLAVSAPGLPKGEFQSVLQFDLSAAKSNFDSAFGPGNWTLTSAAFQLTAAVPGNAIFNTSAAGQIAVSWMQNDSWTEGSGTPMTPGATGITFSTLPLFLSASDQSMGGFSVSGATSGTASYDLNPSTNFLGDLATGGIASFRISAAAGDFSVSGVFNSRSFSTVVSRDQLVLTAVPEPSTLAALISAFFALAFAIARTRHRCRFSAVSPAAKRSATSR